MKKAVKKNATATVVKKPTGKVGGTSTPPKGAVPKKKMGGKAC
jgi:hypothetical protein